ncbi:MAG: hypothetical protein M3548_04705 [Actinomycetota bacterium]|nr:hypothetical protein [Actinomycetota bacterium]
MSLVVLHLLGVGVLVVTFAVQLNAGAGAQLKKAWLYGLGLQLITGPTLMQLAPQTGAEYDPVKLGVKLLVLVLASVIATTFTIKRSNPTWVTPTLGGLVMLNIGLALAWT